MPDEKTRGRQAGPATEKTTASATTLELTRADRPDSLQLLILQRSGLAVYPLPSSGTCRIGRAEECQIRLDDPRASRRHATLHIRPASLLGDALLAIEDHQSANGTLLAARPLEPGLLVPVQLGQTISIGKCLLIVRQGEGADRPSATLRRSGSSGNPRLVREPAMEQLYELVDRLARGSINLLILGETGVGKEVVADAIHRASPRRNAELVRINCAALAEPLLESELFGHERGAFTGAVAAKPGLIEIANGGTVFLDEVGELPALLQAKLLRVIEAGEVTRVGSVRAQRIDVRFISATNRNLDRDIFTGAFRADLMYRLNGASIEVPPLRQRPLEILPLANLFISRLAAQLALSPAPQLLGEAAESLLAHSWPGNVRELRNVMERAVLVGTGPWLTSKDLALQERSESTGQERPSNLAALSANATRDTVAPEAEPAGCDATLSPGTGGDQESQRLRIARALVECGGNQRRAADSLGISRRTLVRKIAQLGLPRPRAGSQ